METIMQAGRRTVNHTCHAEGCDTEVPPRMFMCKRHWYKLKQRTRDAIWRWYRPGQENDKNPSAGYMAVQRFAVGEAAFKPNNEAAALRCAELMLEALGWRKREMAESGLDPLVGLMSPSNLNDRANPSTDGTK